MLPDHSFAFRSLPIKSMYMRSSFSVLFSVPVCLLLLSSCKEKKEVVELVPEVNVVAAAQQDIPVYVEYVGQTYGQEDVEIQPRVEGWITKILFKEGDPVKAGQLLYVIDDVQLQNKVASAEANLAAEEVILDKNKSDLARVEPLAKMNALSQRDLDAAKAAYEAQKQAVASAKAILANARIELGYAKITAPVSGIIGISKVQVGDYVSRSIGQNAINTISAIGAIRVRFSITEKDFLMFKKKQAEGKNMKGVEIEMILSDGTMYPERGLLDFADRTIDPTTGSMIVQAVFKNADRLLRPGQYVKVRFKADEVKGAVLVPQQAINQLQSLYRVFVVNDSSKIVPRTVSVGMRTGSNWVVSEGLQAGEKVAMIGNAMIKPGIVVKPVEMTWNYNPSDTTKVK